jgi:hypothetical protein
MRMRRVLCFVCDRTRITRPSATRNYHSFHYVTESCNSACMLALCECKWTELGHPPCWVHFIYLYESCVHEALLALL